MPTSPPIDPAVEHAIPVDLPTIGGTVLVRFPQHLWDRLSEPIRRAAVISSKQLLGEVAELFGPPPTPGARTVYLLPQNGTVLPIDRHDLWRVGLNSTIQIIVKKLQADLQRLPTILERDTNG